ncbi:MAG: hypothetical protein AB7D02_02760, partial [Candidatus Paceibacterota bacterium]
MSACEAGCFVSFDCNYSTGKCVKRSNLEGEYWSESACNNSCKITYTYVCKSNGTCEKEASNEGYSSESICKSCCASNPDCGATTYYSCNQSTQTCSKDSNGVYSSKSACENNCKSTPSPTTPSECQVTATANPNPIPEGQNQVTISATNLNHTSLSKCNVSNYSLPHTFTQDASSKAYTVKCTGNSGYDDCSSKITVTKEGDNGDDDGDGDNGNGNGDEDEYRCQIFNFQIPHHAWIGYDSLAEWTTNNVCTWA